MLREDRSTLTWTALLLALPAMSMFVISDLLFANLGWHGPARLASGALAMADARADAAARLLILAAAIAAIGVSLTVLMRFAGEMLVWFGPQVRRTLFALWGPGLVVMLLWVASGFSQLSANDHLGAGFLDGVANRLGPAGGMPGDVLIARFELLITAIRLLTGIAAGFIVTGSVACLAKPLDPVSPASEIAFLAEQRERLRSYVHHGAVLLVVAMLFQLAWMRWPLAAVTPAGRPALIDHVNAFALYTGVTGSMVIALVALPVAAILARRAARLAEAGLEVAPAQAFFDRGILESFGKAAVILAPALAGFVPAAVEALGRAAS